MDETNGNGASIDGESNTLSIPRSPQGIKEEAGAAASGELSSDDTSIYGTPLAPEAEQADPIDGDEEEEPPTKKQMLHYDSPNAGDSAPGLTAIPSPATAITPLSQNGKPKKSKKRNKDVWSSTSRKGKKKTKHASNAKNAANCNAEDRVLITPIPRFPDKNDDAPDLKICLSKVHKAEKVELSDDRLSAGSTKGYRMVRATRGVREGAWYFEIKVVNLGETGHTRLGWSTDKGDLQAPVGYDGNSFGYRDVDGSKVHKALTENYGYGYKEGDVIGFYINLPNGGAYAPDPPRLVWYKGQRYVCAPDANVDPPKVVPGESSRVCFGNVDC